VGDELDRPSPSRRRDHAPPPEGLIPVERVEAVLQRAVDLDATEPPAGSIDADTLAHIAAELGIDEMALRRAFAEEEAGFVPESKGGVWDRLLGPDRIAETRLVAGSTETVTRDAEVWFRRHEALRLRSRTDGGAVWEAHEGAFTRMRADLFGPAKPTLRNARAVTLQVRPVTGDEQLVSIAADATPLQDRGKSAVGAVAIAAIVAAVAGILVFSSVLGSLFGLAVALLAVPVIAGFRGAATRLRDGVSRALDAIGEAEEVGLRKPDFEHFMGIGRRWLRTFRGVFGRGV
jgi:hypothetical protein